jgi:hypothetical protein
MSSWLGRRLVWAYYLRIVIYVTPHSACYWPDRRFAAEPTRLEVQHAG